jgi:hypothetical protein
MKHAFERRPDMTGLLRFKLAALFVLLAFGHVCAQTISASSPMQFTMRNGAIIADGAIAENSADEFRAFLKAEGLLGKPVARVVFLRSPGGVLETGIELGRLLRQHGLSVAAFGSCDSACAYMMLGGVNRVVTRGTRIGVHQFYTPEALAKPDEKFYSARDLMAKQMLMARLSDYVEDMGVDQALIALASKTLPSTVTPLSRRQLLAYKIENVVTREALGQTVESLVITGVYPEASKSRG